MFYKIFLKMLKCAEDKKRKMIDTFKNSKEVYNNIDIIVPRNFKKPTTEEIESLIEYIENNNIKFTTIEDEEYPENLKNIKTAPYGIFYKGDISFLNESMKIAIIGARECSTYGKEVAKIISHEICKNNITTISGGAIGIDTIAHEAAVEEKSKTCVVLGCGIDIAYPKRNEKLFYKIIENGCIISEFLPKTPPFARNFPIRNRIISGLCDKLIVIEGGERSGTLITANYAVEQSKDVMAIPGSIFSEKSFGTNRLIQEGAEIYTCKEDLYKFCGIKYNLVRDFNKNNLKVKAIMDIVKAEPIHINEIMRLSNIDIKDIYAVLFELQLKDEIICLPGNYYAKII